MGQAGAQREPSMEEILASIRKIIETNDKSGGIAKTPDTPVQSSETNANASMMTVASGSHAGNAVNSFNSDDYALIHDADQQDQEAWAALQPSENAPAAHRPIPQPEARREVSSGKAPQVEAATAQQTAPAVHPQEPAAKTKDNKSTAHVSLAEVAARMRGQGEVAVGTVRGDEVVNELPDALVGDLSSEDARLSVRSQASREAADGLEEVAKELARIENEKARAEERLAQLHSSENASNVEVLHAADLDDEEYDLDDATDSDESSSMDALTSLIAPEIERQLISVDVSEKVAQSFAALDAVMASGAQRNFDEIAEDLLRPMLQNWLDDNLPTLVERLVREEIERVSRGNRR